MKIVALAGGVGGAKLADGISRLPGVQDLTVIVNTGDDFSLFGLWISPDLDTVCYNLAGFENQQKGWGRDQETWETLREIRSLGGPDWFQLGDRDLATHLERTRRLEIGHPLSRITADFCDTWDIEAAVLPMSDDHIPTLVKTGDGWLPFQEYFVKLGCEPEVKGFAFQNAAEATPAPGVLDAIRKADWIVICPSNPWVSIDPILAVPGIRQALQQKIVLAVSPIIAGQAVKGPAAKMYREMGIEPTAGAVAEHFGDLLKGFVIDDQDRDLKEEIHAARDGVLRVFTTNTWMKSRADRIRVADQIMTIGKNLVEEV